MHNKRYFANKLIVNGIIDKISNAKLQEDFHLSGGFIISDQQIISGGFNDFLVNTNFFHFFLSCHFFINFVAIDYQHSHPGFYLFRCLLNSI